MKEELINVIEDLGGEVAKPKGDSLKEQMEAIAFPHALYDQDWECYGKGVDEFFEHHRQLYLSEPETFFTTLEDEFFALDASPRGQAFWRCKLFTPLTAGTEDYKEWNSFFSDTNYINLEPIRKVVGEGELEFIQIMDSYGYPDHFYVCLQDPEPSNPTVFGTDHEVFFAEISVRGPLQDFLTTFLTKTQFRAVVKEYIDEYLLQEP